MSEKLCNENNLGKIFFLANARRELSNWSCNCACSLRNCACSWLLLRRKLHKLLSEDFVRISSHKNRWQVDLFVDLKILFFCLLRVWDRTYSRSPAAFYVKRIFKAKADQRILLLPPSRHGFASTTSRQGTSKAQSRNTARNFLNSQNAHKSQNAHLAKSCSHRWVRNHGISHLTHDASGYVWKKRDQTWTFGWRCVLNVIVDGQGLREGVHRNRVR